MRHLAAFAADEVNHVAMKRKLSDSFWEPTPERQIIHWLTGPRLAELAEEAFFRDQNDPAVNELSSLNLILEGFRATSSRRQ
jgi:hypothetical protein